MKILEVKVPYLGESVPEASIARVAFEAGSYVNANDLLFELETDKVTLDVQAPLSGSVVTVKGKTGDAVKEGDILCTIDTSASGASSGAQSSKSAPAAPAAASVATAEFGPKNAPSAERIAAEKGVDISGVAGSGKDGRVTKSDMLSAGTGSSVSSVASSASADQQIERVRMSKLRQRIAQRLKESQNTAAILTTFNEVDMTNIMSLRAKYKTAFEKAHGIKLGFMSFFVKAVVEALQRIPEVNAEIEGDTILYKKFYDIGVAVGTDRGLVVPVVRNADKLSYAEIEKEIVRLGQKAREGSLEMSDLSGGTFTISNGGVYGSLLSTPIINPPQSGIMGMHTIQERPVVVDGKIEIRPMMYLALSYDHRIIDGRESVMFLSLVKKFIEDPSNMLLGL